jgi:Uma2 family endonuclease
VSVQVDLLRPVSDDELLALSERNPGYHFERSADGRLIVSPTGSRSGAREAELVGQLRDWNRKSGHGYVFSPSTGFSLSDGALFSPDASWVHGDRWEALTPEQREGFAPLCPDAVFEIRSRAQAVEELRAKIHSYIANGARIAVLIDPYRRAVEVYRPSSQPKVHEQAERVRLEPELADFELDLRPIFED